jgi:polyisoprenoid-binding protein YceI
MKFLATTATVLGLVMAGNAFAADAYDIDPTHAWVSFKTNHNGWANAHGTFKDVSGTISFDKDNVENSSIDLKIQAASIDTNHEQRDTHLKSPDFLNAEEFPEITYKSTKIEKTGDKTAKVTGDLSIAGNSKPVTLEVIWNEESGLPWDASKIKTGFSATGEFDATEFNIPKLADSGLGPNFKLDIDVEALKK